MMADSSPAKERAPYVGTSVLRVEDHAFLTGSGSFVDDVNRDGQLYARVVRSNVSHGRIRGIDTSVADARDDVVLTVTSNDLPDVRIPLRMLPSDEAARVTQPPLAREVVRYVGEPVAVVIATTQYGAEDAAGSVILDIEPLEPVLDPRETVKDTAPVLHPGVGATNVINRLSGFQGDKLDEIFAAADVVVREELSTQRHAAIPLEPRGLVADPTLAEHVVTMWGPTKVKQFNRRMLAGLLDLEEEDLRFIEPDVGGGFGARGEIYPEDFVIPWVAIKLGRPIKWTEDRAEHFVAMNHSREQRWSVEMAASKDGTLLGFRGHCLINQGAYARTHGGVLLPWVVVQHFPGPYLWDSFEIEATSVLTNKTPSGTYRGPSVYESTFVRERVIDLVAARLGMDPAELRRKNLIPVDQMPFQRDLGEVGGSYQFDGGDFPLTFERLLRDSDYEGLRKQVEERRASGEFVGVGLSTYIEAGAFGPYEVARVAPDAGGSFTVYSGVSALGQGARTALGQIAADALRVPFEDVTISHKDTNDVPDGWGAYASRTTVLGGTAIWHAIADLREKAIEIGADKLGLQPDEVEMADGEVRSIEDPSLSVPVVDLDVEGEYRFDRAVPTWDMGANLAVASVDPETGGVKVEKIVLCHDLGKIVNPQLVEGQLVGGAAQGLGGALLEELAYDPQGQPLSTSFMDYLMPTAVEVPPVVAIPLELQHHDHSTETPVGAKGVGESGIIGVGAAIGNAVADALGEAGAEVLALPLTPESVWARLQGRGGSGPAGSPGTKRRGSSGGK
jgi:carbon-monoxide dehydrogenase large subunit